MNGYEDFNYDELKSQFENKQITNDELKRYVFFNKMRSSSGITEEEYLEITGIEYTI